MRVLLHACCGPCLLEPYDALSAEHDVDVVYANPNIHPIQEYRRRRDTLVSYAVVRGIEVFEAPYDPPAWMRAVAGLEQEPGARCCECFRVRLGQAADVAVERRYEALATTLTVSPYQDADAIRDAGREVSAQRGLTYLDTDFRDRYADATRRSRALGMYRQDYCGCMLSDMEAEPRREQRRRKASGQRP
jgi:epoxyqueuosine reductase